MGVLLTTFRGDSKTFRLSLVEPFSTTPFNPTGWHLLATFKPDFDADDSGAAVQKSSVVGGFAVVTPSLGLVDLSFVPADTVDLDPYQRYGGDIQAQHTTTFEIKTVWTGSLKIVAEATRETTLTIPTVVVPPSPGYLTALEMEAAVLAAAASAAAAEASAIAAALLVGVGYLGEDSTSVTLSTDTGGLAFVSETSDSATFFHE